MEGEEGDAIASDSNGDRDTIELPPWQLSWLKSVKESGKKIILVLTGGAPIAYPEDIADAVLFVWYPGEEGGNAVANVIFGDVNPSGKLPVTFPKSTADLPPYEDYALKGRTYRYMEKEPLYPFGFGLSYTKFSFESLTLSDKKISSGGKITAKVTVTNTGNRFGEDVVQLYIAKEKRNSLDPVCSLKAFKRISLEAGKSKTVELTLSGDDFQTVNAEGEYILDAGNYIVYAGDSAPLEVSQKRGAANYVSETVSVNI
jgi:beta-glucosidase